MFATGLIQAVWAKIKHTHVSLRRRNSVNMLESCSNPFNTLTSGLKWSSSQTNSWFACGFAREYLCSCTGYGPGRSIKKCNNSCSLHSRKKFLLGVWIFREWRHKWRTFRPPWPTLPGPGRQPLDGSISLKFLLDSRLQSESFDTLDNLLGFRVQKLWSTLVKIFD